MFLIELEEKKTLLKKLLKINFNISQFDKNYTYYNKETGVYVEDLIEIEYCNRTYVTVMYMKITNNILKIKSVYLKSV
jgi:hypothetical protein